MPRPQHPEYPEYFEQYIALIKGNNIVEVISKYNDEHINYVAALPDDKADFAYAEDKWTVKEAVQHITDTERVFAYRILAIARGESQRLTAFDQTLYVQNCNVQQRSFNDVKEEFKAVRYTTNILLRSLSQEQLLRMGNVSDYQASSNAFAFIIYGHFIHHQQIFEERYLAL